MARRAKKAEEGGAGFLTTYADIVTLLMAFFVLLFAISSIDQVKFLALLKGLEEDFGNTAYQNYVIEGSPAIVGSNQPSGSLIPATGGPISIIPIPEAVELIELASAVESESMGDVDANNPEPGDPVDSGDPKDPNAPTPPQTVLDLTELLEVEQALLDAADSLGLREAVFTEFRERGLVVVLSTDDLLFHSGSAELQQGLGRELIAAFAEVIGRFDNPVFIEGHTDDVPLNRPGYDNWNLSADRASAVVKEFERIYGIAGSRLSGTGRSYFHPLESNETEEGRAKNRRVELVIGAAPGAISVIVGGETIPTADPLPSA